MVLWRGVLHRLLVGFAVEENLLELRVAGRGHDDARREFAARRIARALGDVITFDGVFDVDGIGRVPPGVGAFAGQHDLRADDGASALVLARVTM